jgi:hypothetical protein
VSQSIESFTDDAKFRGFLKNFFGGHRLRGFRKALKKAGPAFVNAASPLRYSMECRICAPSLCNSGLRAAGRRVQR